MSQRILAIVGLVVLVGAATSQADYKAHKVPHDPQLEKIPAEEEAQINNIVRLTVEQMKKRYPAEPADKAEAVLRGVHPKDHGCVLAKFCVLGADKLPPRFRVGVFAQPGREYQAWIRFSNADVLVRDDSMEKRDKSGREHGSRGMAIKLLGVQGTPLLKDYDALTQDFLMVNHPVFAFSNVEDYEALSEVLLKDSPKADKADRFFARIKSPNAATAQRAVTSFKIVNRIKSLSVEAGAFQNPPASPVDNTYFSGAPFLFGPNMVMKYSAKPVAPSDAAPDIDKPGYLRTALLKRLTGPDAKEVVFEFRVQVRPKSDFAGKIETDIEDACFEWKESDYPFKTVAMITIPPQDFDAEPRKRECENLFFTPWHSVVEHQPIGGINRMRLGVYDASSEFRHLPRKAIGK